MSEAQPLLKLTNVIRRYESPDGAGSLTVLDGVSIEINTAESVAIIGPSGSGKSTLLQIIGTLDCPTSGQVLLHGQELTRLDEKQLAAVRNQQIGFVFQAHYLLPQCTVLENVLVPTLATQPGAALPASIQSQKRELPTERATSLLARVGLGQRLAHRPGQLSGGER